MRSFALGLGLLALSACADQTSKGPNDPTTLTAESETLPRAPDAVYLESPASLPPLHDEEKTATLVTLREPVDADRVREVAARFFDALARDDDAALGALFTSDAIALDSRSMRTPLLRMLRTRMRQHDFSKLLGVEAARPADIATYERHTANPSKDAAQTVTTDPHDADVGVRVPMENPRPAGEPLFADTVYLLLRDEQGALRISAEGEDVAP